MSNRTARQRGLLGRPKPEEKPVTVKKGGKNAAS